ncbi:transposase [Streptosporangium sp. NPDC023825]|uniref:transposase n=1 Tax=Streptosporangium sp. NPDC023825 TaxID=3154909 RepID=UPI003432E126
MGESGAGGPPGPECALAGQVCALEISDRRALDGWCCCNGRVTRQVRTCPGAAYDLGYHVVWCPKYRRPVLGGRVKDRLEELSAPGAVSTAGGSWRLG